MDFGKIERTYGILWHLMATYSRSALLPAYVIPLQNLAINTQRCPGLFSSRIATFNIKVFGETKMGKSDVVSELVNITLRYDMVVVQEIKDLDQTVPYDFLDAINSFYIFVAGMMLL